MAEPASSVVLTRRPIPISPSSKNPAPSRSVDIVSSLLTPAECTDLITTHDHEADMHAISGTYTSRLRKIIEDDDLAELLWSRLSRIYQGTEVVDEDGQVWSAMGLNPCFRLCKYRAGDGFSTHVDGRRLATVDTQSFMTVNIYLNTVPAEHGGATRFLLDLTTYPPGTSSSCDPQADNSTSSVLSQNQPVEGSAAIFRDDIYHDGKVLRSGVKYLLRTDMMFQRARPFTFDEMYPPHKFAAKERALKALDLAQRLEDAGNRDEAVRWYKLAFRLDEDLERYS
ncbi:uncharacterized protein PV07_10717 [Cladophialophora immunda]|uniref:Fe2OG dioxygenase domain-containing protein n=1 Tax=Cladophialophora immunda TaxID=569365 RepID=A0A0D2CNE8_9EURO|nr:uncharacterized protein PV07_10717 [Cladophialophora immunda]KIW25044.1 hypothetical protein PV07_10717 [Cladophialophora immunda]